MILETVLMKNKINVQVNVEVELTGSWIQRKSVTN